MSLHLWLSADLPSHWSTLMSCWLKLFGERDFELRKWLCMICYSQFCSALSWLMTHVCGSPVQCGQCHPREGGPWWWKKTDWASRREHVSKHIPQGFCFCFCLQVCALSTKLYSLSDIVSSESCKLKSSLSSPTCFPPTPGILLQQYKP